MSLRGKSPLALSYHPGHYRTALPRRHCGTLLNLVSLSWAHRNTLRLLPPKTLPGDVLPIPRLTNVLALTHNRLAAQQDFISAATHPHALVHVVVDVHQVGAGGDLEFAVGIKDHQVSIAANGNGALAWKQPKNFGRLGGNEIDKLVVVDAPTVHTSVVNQRQAIFNAWPTIGNFREIVLPEGFLVSETERAVVRRDHRDITGAHAPPQRFLVLGWPERRSEDVFGAFKARRLVT